MARNPNKRRCTAKNRKGEPCGNWARRGYKVCYYHGASGGAPKGNKNGITTHERERITLDTLEDEEKELLSQIELNQISQINNEIKLVDIRLRRMMSRVAKLTKAEFTTTERKLKENEFIEQSKETKQGTLSQIQDIEEAITRLQIQKLALIKVKHEVEQDLGINLEAKEAQIELAKIKIKKIKGVLYSIEDTTQLRALLLEG